MKLIENNNKLKKITLFASAISAITGAILGINSLFSLINKAETGYNEHAEVLKGYQKDINKNREEIRFLYQQLISSNHSNLNKRVKILPKIKKRRFRKWNQINIGVKKE